MQSITAETGYANPRFILSSIAYEAGTVRALQSSVTISTQADVAVWNFDYTGSEQTFTVPWTGNYKLETWGAGILAWAGYPSVDPNYSVHDNYGDPQREGAYTSGNINLNKNNKLYVYVGQMGFRANKDVPSSFNGGGGINQGTYVDANNSTGGGATDIRLNGGEWSNFDSLKSRIIVAGGAGGYVHPSGCPSVGGGLNSYDVSIYTKASECKNFKFSNQVLEAAKATQTSGYKFGIGQVGLRSGAGGGYYGGFHAMNEVRTDIEGISISSGGSSFISGHNGCIAITEDSTEDNIKQRTDSNGNACTDGTTDIACSYHYSGYKFTDTVMIDGAGYNWTTVKGEYVGQPQPDGTTATGHSGNGYARITYLGN